MPNQTGTSLDALIQLEREARAFGFDWPNRESCIDQALKECEEIKKAIHDQESEHRIQEEIGDLLHAAISLCLFCGYNIDETLANTTAKFRARMAGVKAAARKRGLENLKGQQFEFLLELWDEVKQAEALK